MTTKLTLTVDESVIKKAKHYAKHTGRSLSELVGNYLDSLTSKELNEDISPEVLKIYGSVKLPADFDEDAELRAYYESKHL